MIEKTSKEGIWKWTQENANVDEEKKVSTPINLYYELFVNLVVIRKLVINTHNF